MRVDAEFSLDKLDHSFALFRGQILRVWDSVNCASAIRV